jgi:Ran GTPase-activating protein (RanGAP) involved in mRNA processing and transport
MQLESSTTLAAQAFIEMLDNYPGLESVSGVPVKDMKDDQLLNLHLPNGELGNVEALVLAHLLQSNKNLKRLILGAQKTKDVNDRPSVSNDAGSSIVQMWKAAVIVFTAVEASPNAKLNVSLWGNIVRKQDCARMRVLMEEQLRERQDAEDNLALGAEAEALDSDEDPEDKKQFEEFEDTPLARLCLIPIHRIEKNLISEVNLRNTGMTDFEIMILADLLKGNRSIRNLDLRGNHKMSETALSLLLEPMLQHKKLQTVSDMPIKALSNLRRLDFDDKMLGDFEVLLLAELLSRGSRVKIMSLKGNKFSQKATEKLLETLRATQVEQVSDIPVSEIRRNKIIDLNLKNKKLGDFEAFLVADLLKDNRSLHHLSVGGNNFRAREAAEKLYCAILAHPTLDKYNLNINITLVRFGQLTKLELASQRPALTDFDVMVLSGLLEKCPQVRHIDLSRNKIGVVGFTAFGHILGELKNLEFLDLHGNHRMNFSVFQKLLEALMDASVTDASVNLTGFTVHSSEFETLRGVLDNDLSGARLTEKDVSTICQAIRSIPFIYAIDLRSTGLNRSHSISVLQAIESSPNHDFVVNFWGYEVWKANAGALRELLQKSNNQEVDIFKIATQMGTMNSQQAKYGRLSRSHSVISSQSAAHSVASAQSQSKASQSAKSGISAHSGNTANSHKESQGSHKESECSYK